jgi:hypothetical protein
MKYLIAKIKNVVFWVVKLATIAGALIPLARIKILYIYIYIYIYI